MCVCVSVYVCVFQIVTKVDIEDVAEDKAYCRCWKSKTVRGRGIKSASGRGIRSASEWGIRSASGRGIRSGSGRGIRSGSGRGIGSGSGRGIGSGSGRSIGSGSVCYMVMEVGHMYSDCKWPCALNFEHINCMLMSKAIFTAQMSEVSCEWIASVCQPFAATL